MPAVVKYDDARNIKAALKNAALDGYTKKEFLEINSEQIRESFAALSKILPSENACHKRIAEIMSLRSTGVKFHSGDVRKALADKSQHPLEGVPNPKDTRTKKTSKANAKNRNTTIQD